MIKIKIQKRSFKVFHIFLSKKIKIKKAKKKYLKASTFPEESFNGFHIAGGDDDIVEQLGFGTLWFH